MRTAIIYSHEYLKHNGGGECPERPERLIAIINGIKENSLLENSNITLIEPKYASIEDLQLAHSREHIDRVRAICEAGGGFIGEETHVSEGSFKVAMLAAGGAIEAAHVVASGEYDNSFALIRPPGHHAGPNYSLGFCIFNNVALAAKHLIVRHRLNRILILDIDAHHGNGTQEIFYNTSSVLYISLHEDPTVFPGTGFIWDVGVDEGRGYTVNIPLPYKSGDPAYWRAFKTIVLPIIEQYKPQIILISAGFDGYYRDKISELTLSAQIYLKIFQETIRLAHKLCYGKLAAVLEGGYNLWFLRRITAACIGKMAGINIKVRDKRPPINLEAQKEAEKIIEAARKVQSKFWSL